MLTQTNPWSQFQEGIGSVPSGTKSVADVMLFNTTELPYHRYRLVDNLAGAELPVGEEESKDKVAPLPAPPQSVLAGDAMVSGLMSWPTHNDDWVECFHSVCLMIIQFLA
jgi:hypothetical protein